MGTSTSPCDINCSILQIPQILNWQLRTCKQDATHKKPSRNRKKSPKEPPTSAIRYSHLTLNVDLALCMKNHSMVFRSLEDSRRVVQDRLQCFFDSSKFMGVLNELRGLTLEENILQFESRLYNQCWDPTRS